MPSAENKTRLAVLVSTLAVGGYEVKLDLLMRRFSRDRFDLTVIWVYPDYKIRPRHAETLLRLEKMFQWPGVETVALPMRRRFDLRLVGVIARLLRQRRCDTLLFMALGVGTFLGPLAGRRAGVKRIVRASDTVVKGTYPRPMKWVDRWMLGWTDAVVVPSTYLRDEMVRELCVDASKYVVIPNGIDLSRFQDLPSPQEARRLLGVDPDGVLIGMVANLNPVKRHHLLLEAAPSILEAVPSARFVLIGEGVCRDELMAQAERLGVGERVHFVGHRSDVPRLLPALDVGVSCSLVETHGISIIEMMAAGVAVVANGVGGIPEIVEQEKTGLLVKSGDVEALAEAVIRVLKKPELRMQMCARAREMVNKRFGLQGMVAAFEREMRFQR